MRSGHILDNRYRLDEPIAAGGVGQVWRGTDVQLGRPIAVKVLRPEYADHPETLARFRAEARHAGALNHPRIAKVYDYGEPGPLGGPPYLVMELVDGPSLADILDHQTLSPVRVLDVLTQAALGLDAAHEAGLVHRDIKPGNILLCPDGTVKITDFGIAHAAGAAPVTRPGVVMGTTQYLAPERATGGGGTPASDLYSLGIVAYECLTGDPPFSGTTAEVMASQLYQPMPSLPPGVPPGLAELLASLTAKDPADRIASAGQLAVVASQLYAELTGGTPPAGQAAQRAEAPRQRPVPQTERVPRAERGQRAGQTSTAEEAYRGEQPPRRDTAPVGRRSRKRTTVAVAASVTVLAGAAGLLASGAFQGTPAAEQHTPVPSRAHLVTPVTSPSASPGTKPSSTAAANGGDGAAPGKGRPTEKPSTVGASGHPGKQSSSPAASASRSASPSPSPSSPQGQSDSPSPQPSSTACGLLPIFGPCSLLGIRL
jgi:eukaryotic-like serine/threonine-protein kinase